MTSVVGRILHNEGEKKKKKKRKREKKYKPCMEENIGKRNLIFYIVGRYGTVNKTCPSDWKERSLILFLFFLLLNVFFGSLNSSHE